MKLITKYCLVLLLIYSTNLILPSDAETAALKVFYTDVNERKIYKVDPDGSNLTLVTNVPINSTPRDLAIDPFNNKLYWVNMRVSGGIINEIRRSNFDGSNEELLIGTGLSQPVSIDLDIGNGKMYWAEQSGGGSFKRANLDGSNVEVILNTGLNAPSGITVDSINEKIYMTDFISQKVMQANLDGSGKVDILTGQGSVFGIDVDTVNEKIYYTAGGVGVRSADLDGSNPTVVLSSGLINPLGIEVDPQGNKFYLADSSADAIIRADLDGSNSSQILSALNQPRGLAILDENSETTDEGTEIQLGGDRTINFTDITADGHTISTASNQSAINSLLADGAVFALDETSVRDITSTATINAGAGMTVTLSYDPNELLGFNETSFQLFHLTGGGAVIQGQTVSIDTVNNTITSFFASATLSDFGVGVNPEPTTLFLLGSGLLGLLRYRRKSI